GLNLESDFNYDANGNVIGVKLPRLLGTADHSGYKYEYDDADNLTYIHHGKWLGSGWSFSGNGFESAKFSYDAWKNRTKTEYQDSSLVTKYSVGEKFDAFNRVSEIDRPWDTSTDKTSFTYDALNDLGKVQDLQGDY